MSQLSALPLRWENLCACTVELCQHACTSVSIPGLSSLTAMHKPSSKFQKLISMPVTYILSRYIARHTLGYTCVFGCIYVDRHAWYTYVCMTVSMNAFMFYACTYLFHKLYYIYIPQLGIMVNFLVCFTNLLQWLIHFSSGLTIFCVIHGIEGSHFLQDQLPGVHTGVQSHEAVPVFLFCLQSCTSVHTHSHPSCTHSHLVGRSMLVGHVPTVHTSSLMYTNHIGMMAQIPAF